MALTISTPYKTNTLASVSGTTFNSNGTPFVAGDVGRFLVFTNGPAIGQIRRIVGYTSPSVVTVDLAWNVSQISAFTDSLPAAGNTWQMSLTLDDIDDGSHIIKDSADSYRWISGAGVVTLTNVFLADVSKNITWNSEYIRLGTGARICLGYIAPGGYGIYGCSVVDLINSSNGFSVVGSSGDIHLYGCNVSISTAVDPFWRLYRGSDQIVRFVDCDMSGNFSGRVQGTRSALIRCTYRGSTSLAVAGGIGAISPFGLISECKVQAAFNAIYVSYGQGFGTVTSPTLDAISGRVFTSLNPSPTGGTFIIEDYIESQIAAAPYVAVVVFTVANAYLSFRQWVSGAIVNAALVPITDSARRVIRNAAASVVNNVTTVSGTFPRYTAEVKKFSIVAGNMAWSAGTSYGPYEEAIASYLYQPQVLSLPLATSSNVQFTMLSDLNVTQTTKATVDAYTLISSADRLYDRYKSWFVDNLATVWPTFGIQRLNGSGDVLQLGSVALTIDATAGTVFNPTAGSNLLAIKATAFSAGTKFQFIQSTSGSITLANAAAISCGVDLDGANLIAQDIDAVTGAISTTGTCRIDVSGPGVYPAATINATSKIRVTAATSGDIHDCQAVVFASGSTFENNSGQPITVLLATGATQPTKLETSGTITYSQPTEELTVSITGILANSKVRIYNVTTATETFIGTPGTSYSAIYTDGTTYTAGDFINLRIHKRGRLTFETTVVASASGWSVVANQLEDEVYTDLAIDGSLVTGFAADYLNQEVNVTVASNFNMADLYAWWSYNLESNDGIRDFVGGITAIDVGNFRINHVAVDLYIDNTTATNLRQLDNRRIFRSDQAYPVKSSGGGGIDVVWRNTVLIAVTGSGVTAHDKTDIIDGVWTAALASYQAVGSTAAALDSAAAGGVTAQQIWEYATRTLTASSDPSAATIAAEVRSNLATELARIDATVSSRNAVAPDNAGLAAIKAKTDALPADPASEGKLLSAIEDAAFL